MLYDFAPLADADWPEDLKDMQGGFATGLNVYRTMAHHPDLLRAWSDLREHVVKRNVLGPDLSEVVILRAGFRLKAEYEMAHHISRGRAIGMEDARIAAILSEAGPTDETDRILVNAVDELMTRAALKPETREALEDAVGPKGILDVMATIGFYATLGFILKSFEVPVDADVAAEPPLATLPSVG